MRWSLPSWALFAALAACAPTPPPAGTSTAGPPAPAICRIGPDDAAPAQQVAERGIGGTGISNEEGDRGIGGTGIVGVITGFASICVGGLEVEYAPTLAADLDGQPGSVADLRAGQVVVVEASGRADALRAERLALRFEASGPVERRDGTTGLQVAGQRVIFAPGMRGGRDWQPGDWVAVSGLRQADGTIMASRLDRRAPGRILVRGIAQREGAGLLRLGQLRFRRSLLLDVQPGLPVVLTGHLDGGAFVLDRVETDLVLADPARRFGPAVDRIVIEAYIGVAAGRLQMGHGTGFAAGLARPLPGGTPGLPRRGVMDLRRQSDGSFSGTELRAPGQAAGYRGEGLGGLSPR
ncbi:hypothetical protein BKE38_27060, partial [Pseudoroseomonas deserti]